MPHVTERKKHQQKDKHEGEMGRQEDEKKRGQGEGMNKRERGREEGGRRGKENSCEDRRATGRKSGLVEKKGKRNKREETQNDPR